VTYDSQLAAISRTPITVVRITLDFCDRIFGTSPCLATGKACYNTRPTCTFTTAYLHTAGKVYRFSPMDTPLPFKIGERPYLKSVSPLPTEIREDRAVVGRLDMSFADEPDTDVGIDPYVSTRSSVQGTFWKKLLARNPNYVGRPVEVLDGFLGEPETNYKIRHRFSLARISLGQGEVKIEATDNLVDLSQIYWPPKIDCKLRLDISASATVISLSDVSELDSSGWLGIEQEIVAYSSKNVAANSVSVSERGAFGTLAAEHDVNDKVEKVVYYSPRSAKNMLGQMMSEVGLVANVDFDLTALQALPFPDLRLPLVEGILKKPLKVSLYLFELAYLADAYMWVGESLMLTFARRTPNQGGRVYKTLTDADNVVLLSASAQLLDEERITRMLIYWDKDPVATDDDDDADYVRLDKVIAPDVESPEWFGKERDTVFFSRWLRSTAEADVEIYQKRVRNFGLRNLVRLRETPMQLELDVEIKDQDIHTGDFVRLSTDQFVDIDGRGIVNRSFQVMKRAPDGSRVRLTLRGLSQRKFLIVAPNSLAGVSWADATPDEQEYGAISNNAPNRGMMDQNGNQGYVIA